MSDTTSQWFHRRGTLAAAEWESVVDERTPGWQHTGIRIATLAEGAELALPQGGIEQLIVPLAGSFAVSYDAGDGERRTQLAGRRSVFSGATDVLYLPPRTRATITGTGRFAVASSPSNAAKPVQHIAADAAPAELRGGGASSREVHNFGTPAVLDADRLIVCEVITPSSNWSSYPPHKHDEHVPGQETQLEEIYYFEAAPARGAAGGTAASAFGLFSAYSSPAGEIEIDAMVRTGDIALIPYGYHGPAVAAPGYDLYYLNVMAGPGSERAWLISDDPAHAWTRASWPAEGIDPRLPLTDEGANR
ncbi:MULTISPECIES: 5-deoxy-glucuronate isomerase [unclassified Microbacterium]|uniref:5-deoxy-glucuronate isomerase n=1 Tax=unclassified Microbacterium TaxID=2609290 RepID=UPI0012FCEFB5|nr:5-deoxy-glucuronate isomerase [Microbacterium sp. MAH-37]MVQ42841.1 5-deoxy-glucuronate isomerase [Microbacterium sp. MAH-37]